MTDHDEQVPRPAGPRPEHRPEEIHLIVETVDRYNPQNIPILEDYVTSQIKSSCPYDRTAVLALLKLYQFNPQDANLDFVGCILALALGALPGPDFNLCLYMLRDEWLAEPIIAHLVQLHQLLEQARFADFWKYLDAEDAVRDFTDAYRLFETNVRDFIAQTLSITYQSIALDRLEEMLDLSGEDLGDWIRSREDWVINADDESLIDLPVTEWNHAKSIVVQEDIRFEQLAKILGRSRTLQ
ncbi:armadillo-type protein [Entophlyctis helioformis]|nr:armadillo-type protein [Entophlyctis helioformis]